MKSNRPNRWEAAHLGFALLMLAASLISRFVGGNWLASAVAVLITLYLIIVLFELAMRRRSKSATDRWIMEVPFVIMSLPLIVLLTLAIICSFARMYISSEGVRYLLAEKSPVASSNFLTDEWDAIYFSGITFTTLGYGDFVPVTRYARMLVLWQLATTILFLLGVLPLLITRLADFDRRMPG